jgi:hypothetical protein
VKKTILIKHREEEEEEEEEEELPIDQPHLFNQMMRRSSQHTQVLARSALQD